MTKERKERIKMKFSKEEMMEMIKGNGSQYVEKFKKVASDQKWKERIEKHTAAYKAFVANGGDVKSLTKGQIYDYLRKTEGDDIAYCFIKYTDKKRIPKIPQLPKIPGVPDVPDGNTLATLKEFAKKYMSEYKGAEKKA